MSRNLSKLPIVVVGSGHAGAEAASAAARIGVDVLLLTLKADAVARLSCNPAIGGIGKSHLVREIDALGGLMGLAADLGGIHFRLLNRSRGPAVQGARVQQDLERYPAVIKEFLAAEPRIQILEGEASRLMVDKGRVVGVETGAGERIRASAVVLTTGTFLGGKLYQGEKVTAGGRVGEPPATALSDSLRECGLRLDRFKTGTPPRLDRESLDYSRFQAQPGDEDPEPLSFQHLRHHAFSPALLQTTTYLATSTPRTHDVVRAHLDRSPLYSGRMRARGPRYCPSFEDKVVKFPDRDKHLLHLEPMGLEHPWIYVNGLSTSFPPEVQQELVASIPGLEMAQIRRYGYAVEYDFVPPTQLDSTLESRAVRGLFLAGQVCGTTGYEEAAALGLVAGTNAALSARGLNPWIPNRFESYVGVMVDDLTHTGVLEPYRMFTSRAELRLSLSPDTADRRLAPVGRSLGLISPDQAATIAERWERIEAALGHLESPTSGGSPRPDSPADRIRRGEDPLKIIASVLPQTADWPASDRRTLISKIRYRGYLDIERRETAKLRKLERVRIPPNLSFLSIPGLSHEIRQRLDEARPRFLGQASRIPGMTPAALGLLAAVIAAPRS